MSNLLDQMENINFIINRLGKELWVQVYGHRDLNGADALFWAGLIPNEKVAQGLTTSNWEHQIDCVSPGFVRYGRDVITYDRFSGFEYEPLIYHREFSGIKKSYIEISEEFRLLNNLFFEAKDNKYYSVCDNGELEPVVKIEEDNVYIKLNYLKRYASVKQMGIALYFDIKIQSDKSLSELGIEPMSENYKISDCNFDYYINGNDYALCTNKSYSVIHGKKILFGVSIEECGYWPYDNAKSYEEYILGINEDGKEITFTSNPDNLANNFGANPDSPHYLTPIYFSKDVLTKYYSKPELYEVNDGHIRCQGLWILQIDNLNKDYVSVYLGDLGRDLPHKEQVYWKSFNIMSDGKLSETKFKRDFLAQFADPEIADMRFKQLFVSFKKKWHKKFGWELFLELSEDDEYNFQHLRIPVSNSQVEFDVLILSLVKTLIDSINEKGLNRLIANKEDLKGSISKIERYFEEQNVAGYEAHIKFLRNLQELRSTGSGHRKGKGYNKASERFGLKDKNFAEVFENILEDAISFIEFLDGQFLGDN
jgi:hypothetical protein